MKVLHIVKTSDGARWAPNLVKELVSRGVEVHAVLPSTEGEAIELWDSSGAVLHFHDISLPTKNPLLFFKRARLVRSVIGEIQPDLVHLHFVTSALMVRLAHIGRKSIPRVFHVPGPLHLEHWFFRKLEILLASADDYWIASCNYMRDIYLSEGVKQNKLYKSYISFTKVDWQSKTGFREKYNISKDVRLIGNISYMYKPRPHLFERVGLKRHEDMIHAIKHIQTDNPDITAVFVGGQWGGGSDYESRLKKMATDCGANIIFTGRIPAPEAFNAWTEFDCAIHVPASENCGGVIDPLMHCIPTIGSDVGGIPEVLLDGLTGWIVPKGKPKALSEKLSYVFNNKDEATAAANRGQALVSHMFDIKRTAPEVLAIYTHILHPNKSVPKEFEPTEYIQELISATKD